MTGEFHREPRYVVFKIKDIKAYCTQAIQNRLSDIGQLISFGREVDGKPPFNVVVVEQDWPEFEKTWAAIEARMTGKQAAVSAEPAAFFVVDPTGDSEGGPLYSQAARRFWNDGDTVPLYHGPQPLSAEPVAYSIGNTLHWHEGKGVTNAELYLGPQTNTAETCSKCNSPKLCEEYGKACDIGSNAENKLAARAFEIADESMLELLQGHAVRVEEHGMVWGLVDEDQREVGSLAEADSAIVEAVEWLRSRGLCDVVENPHGECVVLTGDAA